MTALAGFWSFAGSVELRRPVERMLNAQSIYAPAAPAIWSGDEAALGRRLHALLPEDGYDRRPVLGGDGSVLIADVRLDHREELGRALGAGADEVRMLPDAALVSRALERWDEDALDRIVGDFALVHWNPAKRRLLLARDFAGQRPLHFHRGKNFFACASMPKGLHALPEVPFRPDPRHASDHLALLPDTGTETFFQGIEKVPPGHMVVVTPSHFELRRWWTPRIHTLRFPKPADYAEALREQIDRAVSVRLRRAKGHVAAQLSGGFDSSAVTATAARLLAPERLLAFTSVPGEKYAGRSTDRAILDEGPLAAGVARLHRNVDHVLIRAGDRTLLDGIDRNLFLYESPYVHLDNGGWIHAINDAARERGASVLLGGFAGNVSFSYDGMQRLPELLADGAWLRLAVETLRLVRGGTRAGTVAAATLGPFLPTWAWQVARRLTGRARRLDQYSAISPAAAAALAPDPRLAERQLDLSYKPKRDSVAARLWMMSRVDPGNFNKGVLGGWGLDLRDPSADRRLFEFCLSVPLEQYLHGGQPRALARSAFADRLPAELLAERRKGLQAADWGEAMQASREQLREEVERIAANPETRKVLDTEAMRHWIENWPGGGDWNRPHVVQRYRLALLRGVSTGRFIRKVSGDNR